MAYGKNVPSCDPLINAQDTNIDKINSNFDLFESIQQVTSAGNRSRGLQKRPELQTFPSSINLKEIGLRGKFTPNQN